MTHCKLFIDGFRLPVGPYHQPEGQEIDEKDRQGKKRRKNRPGRALQAHEPDVPGHEQQQQLRRRGADQQAFGYVFQFHAHEYSFLYSLGLSPEYLVKVLVK